MTRIFFITLAIALFLSCANKEEKDSVSTKNAAPALETPTCFDADVHLVNFSAAQEAKVREAVKIIKKVVSTIEFRDRILNHTYKGKKTFLDNNGLTNAQIYKKILEGSESLMPGKNNRMDVELELYHQKTNTIGYTYPNTVRIWINTKYFDKYTPIQVADNLFHEWLHKLGFDHALKYSPSRNFSVPYAIGYLVEEIARQLPKDED